MKLTKSKLRDLIREEIRRQVNERREIGGHYLMKQLKDLAHDAKRSGERKVAKALMYLYDRINQSSRDIDLNADDINDFLNEPRGRQHARDLPDWMVDALFEGEGGGEEGKPVPLKIDIPDSPFGPDVSQVVNQLKTVLKQWQGKEYPSDEIRWKSYFRDIAKIVQATDSEVKESIREEIRRLNELEYTPADLLDIADQAESLGKLFKKFAHAVSRDLTSQENRVVGKALKDYNAFFASLKKVYKAIG
jgi:hypothetical protein